MKGKLCRSLVVVITIVSTAVGLAAAANPPGSAPDNVPRFLGEIEKAGFSSQEGSFSFFDLIKQVCTGGDRYSYKELGVRFWQDVMATGQVVLADEPWPSLQNGQYGYQGTRDAIYWQTYPPFKLRNGVDEYVIVYGVNHQKTGKAAYTSFIAYEEPVFGTGQSISARISASGKTEPKGGEDYDQVYVEVRISDGSGRASLRICLAASGAGPRRSAGGPAGDDGCVYRGFHG